MSAAQGHAGRLLLRLKLLLALVRRGGGAVTLLWLLLLASFVATTAGQGLETGDLGDDDDDVQGGDEFYPYSSSYDSSGSETASSKQAVLAPARNPWFLMVVFFLVASLVSTRLGKFFIRWYYSGHRTIKNYEFPYGGYTRPYPGEKEAWLEEEKLRSRTGSMLQIYAFPPNQTPRAVFIFVHGVDSNMSWFPHVGKMLAKDPHAIYTTGFDLQGFGKSGGFWRGHVAPHEDIVEDIISLANSTVDKIRRRYECSSDRSVPIYIGGLGFGALIATLCAQKYPDVVMGVAVFSPNSQDDKQDVWPCFVPLCGCLCPTLRKWRASESLHKQSRNIAIVRALLDDPAVCRSLPTWGTAREVQRLARKVASAVPKLETNLLYIQGLQDLVSNPKGYLLWHTQSHSLNAKLKNIMLLQRGWHNILLEPEAEHVVDRLCEWIKKDLEWQFLENSLN